MLAVWYDENGPARRVLRFGDRAKPDPDAGEVRVKVHAAGVNPSDVKTRAGLRAPIAFPTVIPGNDGAGVIDACGEGVSQARVGDRVWVFNAGWQRPFGTSAQYVCVPEVWAPVLPSPLSFAQGACLGVPVMTAHRALFADGPVTGLNVLVTGGAGVVGHYAIQLAKWGGANCVAATVSSEAKAAHARAAGADIVVDYKRDDVVRRLSHEIGAHHFHRVVDVDLNQNIDTLTKLVAADGVIAAYASMSDARPQLPFYELAGLNAVIRPVLVYSLSDRARAAAVADIALWAGTGRGSFAIAKTFPFDQAAAAHEYVEAGDKLGHVILEIIPSDAGDTRGANA